MSLKEKILKNKKIAVTIGATALVCVVALVVILLVCCDGKGSDKNSGSGKENGETTSTLNASKEDEFTKDVEEDESTEGKTSEETTTEEATKDSSNNDSSNNSGTGDDSSSEINRDELRNLEDEFKF